jgi:hypothetical protein
MKKNPKIVQAPDLRDAIPMPKKPKAQAPTLPKKNPAMIYTIEIQKPAGGPVLTYNGKSFKNSENHPKIFSRADTAKREAKKLLKQFSILKSYKMWIGHKFSGVVASPITGQKRRAMRGGSKSNPSARINAQLDQAAKKLEDFSGHPVQHLESAYSRSPQSTGLIVGELDLVGYHARRDGKTERYGHHFKKNSRPLLAVTSDGKQLHIVGGQYEFTEAGIEDR